MKNVVKLAFVSLIAIASAAAHAEHLTPQDCHGYPFVTTQSLTRNQVKHELAMLERDGYNPNAQMVDYPGNIQDAEQKLHYDYTRDCLHVSEQQSM